MVALGDLTKWELLAVVMVTMLSVYLLACGIFTVIARTSLYNYYMGAHIALMAMFVSLFVISHHVFKVRRLLRHQERTFSIVQCVLNICYLAACLVTAIGYSALAAMAIHTNYDYVTAMTLSWFNVGLMMYLSLLVGHKLWMEQLSPNTQSGPRGTMLRQSDTQMSTQMSTMHGAIPDTVSTDTSDGTISEDSALRLVPETKSSPFQQCCCYLMRFLYYTCQVLLVLTFLFSAYHPCCVIDDTVRYREDTSMFTVSLPGHRPIALFVKCEGSGSDTVLIENGLGGMVYMGWSFIPKNLSQTYRVCAYDRRGYGWSEGYEHDYPNLEEPQWAGSNIDFLEKLIVAASIPTPFFYVGHSYGGYHMTLLSLRRPELIKGLVFLDSARFSPLSILRQLMSLVANIHATGLLRVAIDTNILNYRNLFSAVVDFNSLTAEEEQRLMSVFRSGNFFPTYNREAGPLVSSNYAFTNLELELGNRTIDKPVLVIDAGDRTTGEWLSQTHFPQYNSSFYKTVNGTDHQSLIYNPDYSWKTKDLIDDFIQYVTSQTP